MPKINGNSCPIHYNLQLRVEIPLLYSGGNITESFESKYFFNNLIPWNLHKSENSQMFVPKTWYYDAVVTAKGSQSELVSAMDSIPQKSIFTYLKV